MDSMHQDLRNALDEAYWAHNATLTPADLGSPAHCERCAKCKLLPDHGNKLRYCGQCRTNNYCSKRCAVADWAEHKLVCASVCEATRESLAVYKAQGGREEEFNQSQRDTIAWFDRVPGLCSEIQLMAWNQRGDSPYIHASTTHSDVDGSGVNVMIMPRSFWDAEPCFVDAFPGQRQHLRQTFGASTFFPNQQYMRGWLVQQPGKPEMTITAACHFRGDTIPGAEIIQALTGATRAEDLVNAFAWLVNHYSSQTAQRMLQCVRIRATLLHGSPTPHGSVPIPSRALNNEVAYMIMRGMGLEFAICLTGLQNIIHLNGREGVIRGEDPARFGRWKVRLDDGIYVSVKALNFVHIRHGNYRRTSP